MIKKCYFCLLALMVLLAAGCSTEVKRVPVNAPIDYSGQWNDTDSAMVAGQMIYDCLSRPWLPEFNKMSGKNPTVIVGTVTNRSHEHINTYVFTKDLERELINSGRVQFVASPQERDEIRAERDDMNLGFTSQESIKAHGHEVGADYMLQGSVNSIKDADGKKFVMFYQVNLELIDLKTNQKVWIGQQKIKKDVKKPRFKF